MKLPLSANLGPNERRTIEQADSENHKKARDIYVAPGRVILTSPDGTLYVVEVDNAGTLSTSAL